jgi:hypothetical protein
MPYTIQILICRPESKSMIRRQTLPPSYPASEEEEEEVRHRCSGDFLPLSYRPRVTTPTYARHHHLRTVL